MVGIPVPFWDGLFSGAVYVFDWEGFHQKKNPPFWASFALVATFAFAFPTWHSDWETPVCFGRRSTSDCSTSLGRKVHIEGNHGPILSLMWGLIILSQLANLHSRFLQIQRFNKNRICEKDSKASKLCCSKFATPQIDRDLWTLQEFQLQACLKCMNTEVIKQCHCMIIISQIYTNRLHQIVFVDSHRTLRKSPEMAVLAKHLAGIEPIAQYFRILTQRA